MSSAYHELRVRLDKDISNRLYVASIQLQDHVHRRLSIQLHTLLSNQIRNQLHSRFIISNAKTLKSINCEPTGQPDISHILMHYRLSPFRSRLHDQLSIKLWNRLLIELRMWLLGISDQMHNQICDLVIDQHGTSYA